jgi:hypothetical protein
METCARTQRRLTLPTIVGGLLLALGVARLLAEVPLLWELEARDNAEAIVYGQAMRLLHGGPLYLPLTAPPYTVTAYMPLFYSLAALLHRVLGPNFLAGRLLTLIAAVCLTILVAALACRTTGQRRSGALAAGLVLTLGFAGPPGPPWLALYRVDVLGVALAVGAVTVLAGGTEYRRVLIAGTLAALALLTKQTLAAATLAGALWLFEQDRRKASAFGAIAVGAPLVVGAVLELAGGAFVQSTITANINPFDLASLGLNLFILAIFQLGPLIAAGVLFAVCGRGERGSPQRLLVYYWLAALLPLAALAKVGSWHNYWIEWSVPTAILASASLEAFKGLAGTRRTMVFVLTTVALAMSTLVAAFVTEWSVSTALASTGTQRARNAAFAEVVACVRATPGQAIAMPMDAVALAGKPLYVEPAIFSILADAGIIPTGPVIDTIRTGGVGVVVMDLRPDGEQWFHGAGQPIWRADVLAAMRESMELRSEKAGRLIYTPRGSQPPGECL